ncbi:hypothetical protein GCM10028832_03230 [Streptomyces sparsus]
MGHDAFRHCAHGTSGARLLACLDAPEGASGAQLQDATGLHRTIVTRRLDRIVDDGLAVEREGLHYLEVRLPADRAPARSSGERTPQRLFP